MNRKYRPSNGSEGDWFTDKFCMNCIHCDPDPCGKKQCKILLATMCYYVTDKEYPSEWTYDENEKPVCTAWAKWDWGNDGDPDDPHNPKAPIPVDPNQLCFPFMVDEVEQNTIQQPITT